jgi:hypothetical protein
LKRAVSGPHLEKEIYDRFGERPFLASAEISGDYPMQGFSLLIETMKVETPG